MSEGWICPRCGRALAPWMPECPCYQTKTVTASNFTLNWGNTEAGRCEKVCDNKTDMGYCRTTVCINPRYGGDQDYGIGRFA